MKSLTQYLKESLNVNEAKLKVGDKIKGSDGLTKDKTGEVMSIKNDMAQVDFGGGNKYGIALSRIEKGEFKIVNEAEIDSESEFRSYAETVLKNAHGDNYDESIASKMIDDLISEYGSDFGAMVGVLQNSLG